MRILKSKVALALKRRQLSRNSQTMIQTTTIENPVEPAQRMLRARVKQPNIPETITPKGSTSCKNIMKNYSRAFTAFALSSIAVPYLTPILQKYQIDFQAFIKFIKHRQQPANCIKGLRDLLLLVRNTDSAETAAIKKTFQEICVVFLKFFSVNWIFHGRIADKSAHLSYRHRILRRIKNPAIFTYLEDFHQKN